MCNYAMIAALFSLGISYGFMIPLALEIRRHNRSR